MRVVSDEAEEAGVGFIGRESGGGSTGDPLSATSPTGVHQVEVPMHANEGGNENSADEEDCGSGDAESMSEGLASV